MSQKFNRRSIRLKGYDYSKEGLYFVTICCQDRVCRFGKVVNGEMILNKAGIMIDRWIQEIPNKFIDIQVDEYVIMPNHIHVIFVNNGNTVGVDLRVNPNRNPKADENSNMAQPNDDVVNPPGFDETKTDITKHSIEGEHKGSPLHRVVQWFKTMSTNEYIRGVKNLNWEPFNKKIWHRNYYEHIIRDENAYHNISNYIRNNPLNWEKDKFHS